MKRTTRHLFAAAFVATGLCAIVASSACGTSFDASSKILGVRILATKASKPYAKPGDTVDLTMLVADGRADQSVDLTVSWIPAVCSDPIQDLYYACFAPSSLGDGGAVSTDGSGLTLPTVSDGGAEGGASAPPTTPGALASIIAKVPPGTNITPFLPHGTTYSFTVPTDIITRHPPTAGAAEPYGLAILFNYACAGHLQIVPLNPNGGPQQIPLGCFDDSGNTAPVDNGVLGFVRVYAYDTNTNTNPVISGVTQDGNIIDLTAGITLDHCTTSRRSNCPKSKLTPTVPDTSWELNPDDKDENGNPQHEEIWVDYFSTIGDFGDDARLLYDVAVGKIASPEVDFQAPNDPGEGTMWIVVHDSRGGVEWAVVPLHVK